MKLQASPDDIISRETTALNSMVQKTNKDIIKGNLSLPLFHTAKTIK